MAFVLTIIATASAIFAVLFAYVTARIWRSSPAVYETNREITGTLRNAALGQVAPIVNSNLTDFRVNHFVEVCESKDGNLVLKRAASLSDEAVDGVLARH
jgi:hypothetical protein